MLFCRFLLSLQRFTPSWWSDESVKPAIFYYDLQSNFIPPKIYLKPSKNPLSNFCLLAKSVYARREKKLFSR